MAVIFCVSGLFSFDVTWIYLIPPASMTVVWFHFSFSYRALYCNLCFSARIRTCQGKTVRGCGGQFFACEQPVRTAGSELGDSSARLFAMYPQSHWSSSWIFMWPVIFGSAVAPGFCVEIVLIKLLVQISLLLFDVPVNYKVLIYAYLFLSLPSCLK